MIARNNLKFEEAPPWQVSKLDGKIEALEEVLGIHSFDTTAREEE